MRHSSLGPRVGGWPVVLALVLLLSGRAYGQRPLMQLNIRTSTSNATDVTNVYFEQGATTGFDSNFDAIKLPNTTGLNLASFAQTGEQLAINGLPPAVLSASFTVSLYVGVPQYDTYTLEVGQLNNFGTTAVYLYDDLLNVRTPLAPGTTVAIDMTAANTGGTYATSTRFSLQFDPATTPLPVTLTSFEAEAQPGSVRISWQTATEQQSDYFAIERSPDGRHFAETGRVAAVGTSAQARAYIFVDTQPLPGLSYYRLRQVDLDGHIAYSPMRSVQSAAASHGIEVFPTRILPGQALSVQMRALAGAGGILLLTDALGRPVLRQPLNDLPAGTSTLQLPVVGQLAPGVYWLRMQQGRLQLSIRVVQE